jgi:hypothetical protein
LESSKQYPVIFSKGSFMKRIKARASILYLLAGLGTCILLFGSFTKSNTAQQQFNPIVTTEVPKLEIIQTKMLGPNVLEVIMRNGYSKDITAVVASIGDTKTTRTDYIFAEREQSQTLSPGETDNFTYTVDSTDQENIVIKAVLFSDMTKEGSPAEITKVLERRLGVKIQLGRFNSHLEELRKIDYTKVSYKQIQTELQKLKQIAENLPIKTDDNLPITTGLEFGLKHGSAFILLYLSKMNNVLVDERDSGISINKQPMSDRYEMFREMSSKVENDFKSLGSRL